MINTKQFRRSRFARPNVPLRGIRVQPRDAAILEALARFRFLTSLHVQALIAPAQTLRVTQGRLRLLFEHRLVERAFLPLQIGASHQERTGPVYTLSAGGADILADWSPTLPVGKPGFGSHGTALPLLRHHLVVADLLVALDVALGVAFPGMPRRLEPEAPLWRRLDSAGERGEHLVPDAAVTLGDPARTYYAEVVRADVRGGNDRLVAKLARYAELIWRGRFRELYGHERIRAVLVLTTSDQRAEQLRRAAERLTHGRQLFWFGSYAESERGKKITFTLTPDTILERRWHTIDGEPIGFAADLTPDFTTHASERASSVHAPPDPRRDDLAEPVLPVRPPAG